MKRYFFLLTVFTVFYSCSQAPEYPSRAEAIAAEMHNPDSKYVIVTCHRGDWRNFPENSLQGIESIIRYGADVMELDIHLTKDSVLVLSHDDDVKRCTNFRTIFKNEPDKSARISDLTYAEIQKLSLKRAHGIAIDTIKMPTLREALLCCKGRICVNIDKGIDYYDRIMEISEDLGVTGQILIKSSKSIETIAEIEKSHTNKMMYMPIVDVQREKGRQLFNSYIETATVPMAYEVCWNNYSDNAFADACEKIKAQGSKIWVNTIWASLCGGDGHDDDAAFITGNPDAVYQPLIDKGVSMIQTDRPEMLIKWLEKKGLHKKLRYSSSYSISGSSSYSSNAATKGTRATSTL